MRSVIEQYVLQWARLSSRSFVQIKKGRIAMTWNFVSWLRLREVLSGIRGKRWRRRRALESIRISKRFLDFERLEDRASAADAVGPFMTTSALAMSGRILASVLHDPLP